MAQIIKNFFSKNKFNNNSSSSKQQMDSVLLSVGEGVYGVDENLFTTFFNPAAEKLLGWSAEEMIGVKQHSLTHHTRADGKPYPAKECLMYMSVQDGETRHVTDELFWRKDGTSFEVEYTASPMKDNDGKVTGAIVVFRDISARIKMERELIEARKKAEIATSAKSDFLANMSHEIRTPMNGIIGTSSLMRETKLTRKQKEYLNVIRDSSESLLQLLNDILDFSKIEAGKLDFEIMPFDINILLEEVKSIMGVHVKQGIEFTVEAATEINYLVEGDPGRLRQILINLVNNAIKFTKSGYVKITVDVVGKSDDRHEFKFCVEDTGIGIPKDKQDKIFNEFDQAETSTARKFGGTGLGLAISKKLVEKMEGEIGVDSIPDKGSKFWFTVLLPVSESSVSQEYKRHQTTKIDSELKFHSPSILLVEDNITNQMIATEILKKYGCDVIMAANGIEAVKLATDQNGKQFDLVFMDCQMPEMDGFEATGKIREYEKDNEIGQTPIIAFTANAMKGDRNKCLDAGMDDYISKPVKKENIGSVLLKWLADKQVK